MNQYNFTGGFYLLEDEESLLRHIMPRHYIDRNSKKIDADFMLRFLQNELRDILQSFVNGGFSDLGFIFYPFIKGISKENRDKIKRLQEVVVLLDKNYDFSDSINAFKSGMGSRNLAAILSSLYLDLSKIGPKKTKKQKKPRCMQFDVSSYSKSDLAYLNPVNKLKEYAEKELKPYLSGFYVHGSIATKDYIKGWSDLDTLGIISKDTIKSPKSLLDLRKKLYKARKFFYQADPLQHHGSMILPEYDVDNYCQAYFPLTVFKYSLSLFKNDREMEFKVRDSDSESIEKLFWFVNYFRMLKQKKPRLDSYETKNLLHACTIFPVLYLQAKGSFMYKKFSFGRAKKEFKKEDWEIIDYVSSLRSGWKPFNTLPLISTLSCINPVFYYQLNSRIVDIFDGIKRKNKIDNKRIIEDMFSLSEIAWEKIKKNAKKQQI